MWVSESELLACDRGSDGSEIISTFSGRGAQLGASGAACLSSTLKLQWQRTDGEASSDTSTSDLKNDKLQQHDSQPMSQSFQSVWEASASQPFEPAVSKQQHFNIAFCLLLFAIICTGLFGLSMRIRTHGFEGHTLTRC